MIKADEDIFNGYRCRMKRINRIFDICFFVCAAPVAVNIFVCLVGIMSYFMTVGLSETGLSLPLLIVNAVIFIVYSCARLKNRKFIYISMGIIGLQIIVKFIKFEFPFLLLVQLGMQFYSLGQMDEVDKLSKIDGYPDFNGIFTHAQEDKSVLLERPSGNVLSESPKAAVMEDVPFQAVGAETDVSEKTPVMMDSIGTDFGDDDNENHSSC